MAPCAIALQELINVCYQYSNEIDLNNRNWPIPIIGAKFIFVHKISHVFTNS